MTSARAAEGPGRLTRHLLQRRWRFGESFEILPADIAACEFDLLTGALAVAVADGDVDLSPESSETLIGYLEQGAERAVALEARACATVDALNSSGIETRILKGVAVAVLDYPAPEARRYRDIDILVAGCHVKAAIELLQTHDFERHIPEPHAGFDEHFGKGVAMLHPDGTVIDLHRSLALGYYGSHLDLEDVWSGFEPFELGGVPMRALDRSGRLLHCALHMALAPVRRWMHPWDLCTIAAAGRDIDPDDLGERAAVWGCAHPVASAFVDAAAHIPDDPDLGRFVTWARGYRPTVVERMMAQTYHGHIAGSKLRTLTESAGFRTWQERISALRFVFPKRSHDHTD